MDVSPTPKNKGLTLTLRLTAYDNGMIQLDGVPLNDHVNYDPATGWTAAAEVIAATVSEFQRQVAKRKDS